MPRTDTPRYEPSIVPATPLGRHLRIGSTFSGRVRLMVAVWCLGLIPCFGVAGAPPEIVRLDPRFDQLVPTSSQIEKLADGFAWVEGPVWFRKRKYLLFSDIPNNAVMKWKEGDGVSQFLKPSGYSGTEPFLGREPGSNGLVFDAANRLILCDHGDRRLASLQRDGTRITLVSRYEGKQLNSPNDAVFKSNGDLYFTDPPFGLPKTFDDPGREMDFSGVYRVATDGKLTLLTKELREPNGLAFSPDEQTLYVSNADPKKPLWMAYAVKGDGTLGDGRVFVDGTSWLERGPGGADGIKVDQAGHLFTAGPGGIYVLAPDAKLLGIILLGVPTSNCAWGDDGSSLFITADKAIYRIRTGTKGVGT